MNWVTKAQIIAMHTELIAATGGLDGVHNEALLESALAAPFQSYDKTEFFPSVISKAARLGYGLICNHPFIDGNKRIGAHAMLVTLALNGINLAYEQTELIDIIISVAAGERGYDDMHKWIVEHIENV